MPELSGEKERVEEYNHPARQRFPINYSGSQAVLCCFLKWNLIVNYNLNIERALRPVFVFEQVL